MTPFSAVDTDGWLGHWGREQGDAQERARGAESNLISEATGVSYASKVK
jgi:hypothetical protein